MEREKVAKIDRNVKVEQRHIISPFIPLKFKYKNLSDSVKYGIL